MKKTPNEFTYNNIWLTTTKQCKVCDEEVISKTQLEEHIMKNNVIYVMKVFRNGPLEEHMVNNHKRKKNVSC